MKKMIIPLFITIFTVFNANAGGPMSFNGQDGENANARNMTIDEWLDLIIRGKTTDGLAYYAVCPQDVLQSNIAAVTVPAQRILIQQLNAINNRTNGKLWAVNGKKAEIKTAADAEEIVRAFVVSKPLEKGKTYRYISLDNSLNGKTGVVLPRTIYFDGEEGFFLRVPNSTEEYLLASAACANPVPVEEFSSSKPGTGKIEQFDTTYSGHGVTVINNITIDNSGNFNNSGNSTVTTAAPAKKAETVYEEEEQEERPRRGSRSSGDSYSDERRSNSGSDDYAYDAGGAGAVSTSSSNSDSHNLNFLNGNMFVLGGGGGYQQPRYGSYPQPRHPQRPPCYNCGPRPRPTPPINPGQGQDWGLVGPHQGGNSGGGQDWGLID